MNALGKTKKILFVMVLALSSTRAFADNVQHVIWQKTIIPIQVPIGQEKMIEVCAPSDNPSACQPISFTPYLPQIEVSSGALKWINNQGTLYLNATKPFANKLAELKLNNRTGDVVLIRLTATQTAGDNRIEILLPGQQSNTNKTSHDSTRSQEDKSIGDMAR